MHLELSRSRNPLDQWAYLRLVNLGLVHGAPVTEVSALLENLNATTNSAVLTEKLADLYELEGKPSSAIDYYQRALKLNSSPEQKIRIELTLGEKLQEQNRIADAIADYKNLLQESPDYPGRNLVEEKLTALQQNSAAKP